ncbi:MAG: hypothetical protein RLZZ162_710, partial [Verrucomicrobiota bacterium]
GVDPDTLEQFFAGHGDEAAPKQVARKSGFASAPLTKFPTAMSPDAAERGDFHWLRNWRNRREEVSELGFGQLEL